MPNLPACDCYSSNAPAQFENIYVCAHAHTHYFKMLNAHAPSHRLKTKMINSNSIYLRYALLALIVFSVLLLFLLFLLFTLEYSSTFSKLIFLFRLQSFCFFLFTDLSLFSFNLSSLNRKCVEFICARVCMYVSDFNTFGPIKEHTSILQVAARNFEEIDFCRLIFSLSRSRSRRLIQIVIFVLLAGHTLMNESR